MFEDVLESYTQDEIDENMDFIIFPATYVRGSKKDIEEKDLEKIIENTKLKEGFVSSLELLLEKKWEECRKEGIDLGREGIDLGRERARKEKLELARVMKPDGVSHYKILLWAGLTIKEIDEL